MRLLILAQIVSWFFAFIARAQCNWVELPFTTYTPCENGSLTLRASVESPSATYEWRRVSDGAIIATGATPVVQAIRADQSGAYQCIATVAGEGGCAATSPTFIIQVRPVPTVSPGSSVALNRCFASEIVLEVGVSGSGPFTYQWFKGASPVAPSTRIVGTSTSRLVIANATLGDGGTYTCNVTNACGTRTSGTFTLTVSQGGQPINAPPSVLLCGNNQATLSVQPGSPPIGTTVRWFRGDSQIENGGRFSGATTTSLSISPIAPEDLLEPFRCEFVAPCLVTSTTGILIANDPGLCGLAFDRVATGLSTPVYACAPIGDFNRLFIAQRSGSLRVLDLRTNTVQSPSYLVISGVANLGEDGFLGLAFHPRFEENGYFYVCYSNASSDVAVVRYRAQQPYMTSTSVEAGSASPVVIFDQNSVLHNGGWIGFRPDDTNGYLYITVGDGVAPGSVQNTSLINGKIARIDIDGPDNIPGNQDDADPVRGVPYRIPPENPFANADGLDEIVAMGLRNPWRCSFDRDTGDMYIGDVGQGAEEEISMLAADTPASQFVNFGWPCFEGRRYSAANGCVPTPSGATGPLFANGRNGGCAITGGFVYRGTLIPSLRGFYLFSDYCAGFLYAMNVQGATQGIINATMPFSLGARMESLGDPVGDIPAFGEDADGEVYVMDATSIYRIIDSARVPVDCNANGIDDALDISRGIEGDCDNDGVPNSCDSACCPACPADFDQDGGVTGADIAAFFAEYEQGAPCADADQDGGVTGGDIAAFFVAYEAGGC